MPYRWKYLFYSLKIFKFREISCLKQLFAIVLLSIYLFNLAGYALFFQYFIHRSDIQLVQQINKDQYSDEELIEVKVPLHMPYMTSWSDYERIDGTIEISGAWYNYVKRKVSNDTLYLKCVLNTGKTGLCRSKSDYGREAAKKTIAISEYNRPVIHYDICPPVTYLRPTQNRLAAAILDPCIEETCQPPRQNG